MPVDEAKFHFQPGNDFQEFFENMPDGWDGRGIFEIMTGTSN